MQDENKTVKLSKFGDFVLCCSKSICLRSPMFCVYEPYQCLHMQVKGEVVVGEFASANDPDEYEWTVTAEGTGTAQDRLKQQIQTLQSSIYQKLQQYDQALNALL